MKGPRDGRSPRAVMARGLTVALMTAALLMGGVTTVGVPSVHAAVPGSNGKIVYTYTQGAGGSSDLYTMNSDGSQKTDISNTSLRWEDEPSVSPDGTKVVFRASGSANRECPCAYGDENADGTLVIANIDGSAEYPLTATPTVTFPSIPAWSPDGSQIAFDACVQQGSSCTNGIWLADTSGTNQNLRLLFSSTCFHHAAWSPDGKTIAVDKCDSDIWVITVATGQPKQITDFSANGGIQYGRPTWSPDGTQIAMQQTQSAQDGYDFHIAIMNADGSGQHTITSAYKELLVPRRPSWSPDGTAIAFQSTTYTPATSHQTQERIYTIKTDGTGLTPLTDGSFDALQPSWAAGPPAPVPVSPVAVLPAMSNGAYGGYITAATIQNTGTAPAAIRIAYFDQSGAPVGAGDAIDNLAPKASWTVRQDNGRSFPHTGGNAVQTGSAIISTNAPIAAFVNEFPPGNVGDATSYSDVPIATGVGPNLYAPTIVNNAYGGYTTGIGLLNESDAGTDVTITYRDGGGTIVQTQGVPGLAAHAYKALYSGDPDLGLPPGFAGTATITSAGGQLLGAVVNETGPGGQFSSYDAVPSGATLLNAPVALHDAFGGYNTGMGIQNTSASASKVTVTYYDSAGTSAAQSFDIAGSGSLGIYQGDPTGGPAAGAYTATIESAVPLVAIVNEVAPSGGGGAQQSTSYNTVSAGGPTLYLPLVENAGSDPWNTGEGIMNTGSTTTVTVAYYDAVTGAPLGIAQTDLAPRAFWGVYQPSAGLPAGKRATAVITTSAGGQVAVICNESSSTTFMSYGGQPGAAPAL